MKKKFTFFLSFIIVSFVYSCQKEPQFAPTVITKEVNSVESASLTCVGEVSDDGGTSVTERGFCWSEILNPTIEYSTIKAGSGKGEFRCQIPNLKPGKQYYIRAYAMNKIGISYGNQLQTITKSTTPNLTTLNITDIKYNSAIAGGKINSDGGSIITEKGICWATTESPIIESANKIVNKDGTLEFFCQMSDLIPGTKYYLRAYAINNMGVGYGNQVLLSTEPIVIFQDIGFKSFCIQNFDVNKDGELSQSEALQITTIDCYGYNFSSLKGIEYMSNLSILNCRYNKLSELDVSHNSLLSKLYCTNNILSEIDVSKNTSLTLFWCEYNIITSLDVSHNILLSNFICDNNKLKALDISNNPELDLIWCNGNQLEVLDTKKNFKLTELICGQNPIKSLDLTNNKILARLWCSDCNISTIDLSQNPNLFSFVIDSNQLDELDISKNTMLKLIYCRNNKIKSLDVSNCPLLKTLNTTSNTKLYEIWLKNGQIISTLFIDSWTITKYKD